MAQLTPPNNGVYIVNSAPLIGPSPNGSFNPGGRAAPPIHFHSIDLERDPNLRHPLKLFHAFANSFGFADYYGYGLAALPDCLTVDLALASEGAGGIATGHVLTVVLGPLSGTDLGQWLTNSLHRVCQFHKARGALFIVYVVERPRANWGKL